MAKMAGNRVLIEFFYDVISPYSWLAFEVLCRYKPHWKIDLQLKPFFLGGIMKESGNTAPAAVANKALYINKDISRLREYFQVPASLTDDIFEIILTKGSLQAQRFITAVDMSNPEYTENLSRAFWMRMYKTHEDITEPDSFKQAAKAAGISEAVIQDSLTRISSQDTKDRLKQYTQQALDYGAFGAPITIAHVNGKPELFFGADRMELLSFMLGEKWLGPVPNPAAKI